MGLRDLMEGLLASDAVYTVNEDPGCSTSRPQELW